MSTYGNDFDKLRNTFVEFLHHLPFYGVAVVCLDDEEIQRILPAIQRPTLTYGFHEEAHYRAVDWKQVGLLSEFTVIRPSPHAALTIQFKWPGRHNVLNALAAIIVATDLGVSDEAIVQGLYKFQGVGRRFQMLGECHFTKGSALIVDDYGHHPREIRATIDAFRSVWPDKRLVHVFQPHRYSRTQSLFTEFVNVLSLSDEVLLLDIYSAGEAAIPGVSSESLAGQINLSASKATFVTEQNLELYLDKLVVDGDVILMQGAGNVGQLAANLMQKKRQETV
jgi:UDP-N-acetylmuramate--alanine ligase